LWSGFCQFCFLYGHVKGLGLLVQVVAHRLRVVAVPVEVDVEEVGDDGTAFVVGVGELIEEAAVAGDKYGIVGLVVGEIEAKLCVVGVYVVEIVL